MTDYGTCEWFAMCDRPARGYVTHPVIGAVPTCVECARTLGLTFAEPETGDLEDVDNVNYGALETGCYVGGHSGQYGPDRFVEQFGTHRENAQMAEWRAEMESEGFDPMHSDAHEMRAELCDAIEQRLAANLPEGLACEWRDGEFFIVRHCGADLWAGETCAHCGDGMGNPEGEWPSGLPIMDPRVGGGVIDCDCACHDCH